MADLKSIDESIRAAILSFLRATGRTSFTVEDLVRYRLTPLTGPPFYLTAPDLYRLLIFLEERFKTILSIEAIYKYGFRTVRDIEKQFEADVSCERGKGNEKD